MLDTFQSFMISLGFGQYFAVLLALIGVASAVSTIWPPSWPGAKLLHWLALLKGNAAPAIPAGSPAGTTTVTVAPGQVVATVAKMLVAVIFAATLSACTAAQVKQVQADYAEGQLFCQLGSGVIQALEDANGNPVLVTGQTAAWVVTACKLVDAFAVPVAALPTTSVPAVVTPPAVPVS